MQTLYPIDTRYNNLQDQRLTYNIKLFLILIYISLRYFPLNVFFSRLSLAQPIEIAHFSKWRLGYNLLVLDTQT